MQNVAHRWALLGLVLVAGACGDGGISDSNDADLRLIVPGSTAQERSASHDFGDVPVRQREAVTFEVINLGTDSSKLENPQWENTAAGVFYVLVPSTISGGARESMVVTFQPPSEGPYTGRFVLEHTGRSIALTVDLSGNGYTP